MGKEPSLTALDNRRVIVQLNGKAHDPETGRYTLKRWRVTKRAATGEVEEVTLGPDNHAFKPIVLDAHERRSADRGRVHGDGRLMALPAQEVECLLMAIPTVNNFSLEKAWKLLPRMRELGLTDPGRVVAMDMPAAIEALTAAGYDRKKLTWMFAERVKALMAVVRDGKLDGLAAAVAARDERAAAELLGQVRGVGPRVIESAWALLAS